MKKAVRTAAVLLLLLSLCACGLSEEELRERAIDQLNQNSDLPFELLLPEGELGDINAYTRIEGYGGWGLENEDAFISISGYPDVQDAYHVTEIRLRTPKYSVFGLRVGDTAERAAGLLKSNGYTYQRDYWNDWRYESYYKKENIEIRPECLDPENGQDVIYELTVSILSTNVEDVDF